MKSIKISLLSLLMVGLCLGSTLSAQERTESLKYFNKLVVSPHIELILIKGDQEQVVWDFKNISEDKLNVELDGKTLHLYLDKAKVTPKLRKNPKNGWNYKESIYRNARVKAYVTYRDLESLEVRGAEMVISKDPLVSERFRLKLYGEGNAYFSSIEAEQFKASLYGEFGLDIGGGHAPLQSYRCYGENLVRAVQFEGQDVSATIYGESDLNLNASRNMKVSSLGEGKVFYKGAAELHKGLMLGETSISRSKSGNLN